MMDRQPLTPTHLLHALGSRWDYTELKEGGVALRYDGKTLQVADTLDEALDWLIRELRQGNLRL
jgi:hypothetical protein